MLFKMRVASHLISPREIRFLVPKKFSDRNIINLNFFSESLGFSSFVPEVISDQDSQELNTINLYQVFLDKTIIDHDSDIFIDINYPFWKHPEIMKFADKLPMQSWIVERAFKSSIFNASDMEKKYKFDYFLQYRLGDVALTPGSLIDKFFNTNEFSDVVFLGTNAIPAGDIIEYLETNNALSQRIIVPSVYSQNINKLSDINSGNVLSSDGFSRLFHKISSLIGSKSNESDFTDFLFDSYKIKHDLLDHKIVGESESNLQQSFIACSLSSQWIRGTSGFPFSYFLLAGVQPRFSQFIKKSSLEEITLFLRSFTPSI